MRITSATHQGARGHQEDRFVVKKGKSGGGFFAVMDGHRGDFVSGAISRDVWNIFESEKARKQNLERATRRTFSLLHNKTNKEHCGSTLSWVWIPPKENMANIAILGDSPVIIKRRKNIWVSPEHNARNNEAERSAAEALGAIYDGSYLYDGQNVSYGLQMSRAFGDFMLDKILNRKPEIFRLPISKGDIIIVATDGVVDPGHENSSKMARHILSLVEKGGSAEDLVADALQRQTNDNVTAIVCRI